MRSLLNRVMFPPPGHYILAVSDGLSSIVLLHLLATTDQDLRLRVAHGEPSAVSHKLLRDMSRVYGLPFHTSADLPALAQQYGVDGIIAPNYYDDTAKIVGFDVIIQPLMAVKRADLIAYADRYRLPWRQEPAEAQSQVTANPLVSAKPLGGRFGIKITKPGR